MEKDLEGNVKFLWEIYSDLIEQKLKHHEDDYPDYDIDGVIQKLKERIDLDI